MFHVVNVNFSRKYDIIPLFPRRKRGMDEFSEEETFVDLESRTVRLEVKMAANSGTTHPPGSAIPGRVWHSAVSRGIFFHWSSFVYWLNAFSSERQGHASYFLFFFFYSHDGGGNILFKYKLL